MAGLSWPEGVSNETGPSAGPSLEAEFQDSAFAVAYGVVFVLGLVGNALSLYLLSCRVKHLSHSYIYRINLALVDTSFVCVLPFQIHSGLHGGTWIFGDTACRVTGALFHIHIYLSIAFFTCICVDLYVAVLHPFTSIQLRASHYVLVAAALWVVALGVMVPLVLRGPLPSRNPTACFEDVAGSGWAHPTAPQAILALVFGFVIPFSIVLLGFPLVARGISRCPRRVPKRKALGTIYIILGICALCFLPYHLSHLLHFLVRIQVIQEEPLPSLIPGIHRVTSALPSLSCCLNPLLYYFSSSSRQWHCPFRLRFRSKRVFTICEQNFGVPSWDAKPRQRRGRKHHGEGIN
ncbi:LPAR6 protein, partial [Menura novaehollandiae]|nr:LPAR6 protein [Menura novaehollandiae]